MDVTFEQLGTFIDRLPVGVMVVEPPMDLKHVNERALELLGIGIDHLLTDGVDGAFSDNRFSSMVNEIASGGSDAAEVVVSIGGRSVQCSARAGEPADNGGRTVITVLQDVSRIRQLDQIEREFLSTILQQIRGPISGLHTAASVLLESLPDVSDDVRELLSLSYRETTHLNNLLGDLRDLFVADTGKAAEELEIEKMPVERVVLRAVHALRDSIESEPPLHERIYLSGETREVVYADFEKLKTTLQVIIRNALQYSPPDRPIEVRAVSLDDTVTIEIRDKGTGIRRESLSRIFTRFFREDNQINRSQRGSGLGLYIAHTWVELMNGSVSCESEVGCGTVFYVSLPRGEGRQ